MHSRKLRAALALTCVLALAALLALAPGSYRPSASGTGSVASKVTGDNDQAIAGAPNEERSPDFGAAGEEGALRAGPADFVPFEWTQAAMASWDAMSAESAGKKAAGQWEPIGPSPAIYPGVLNRTGSQYSASGRITALSIGNTCSPGNCRLLVGAAGGGIWRTDKALAGNVQWDFTSEELPTNAIGTIEKDPNDPSGNTLYVGTGEPNASADSEAGLGVFKSTDGGSTWAPIANNAPFLDRSISTIRIVPGSQSTIYVATTRGVRGVSGSLSAGAVSLKPNAPIWGLYKSTDGGATWTFLFDGTANAADCDTLAEQTAGGPCSLRGVIDVELDPSTPSTVYAATYGFGIWRSTAAGAGSWTQIFSPIVDNSAAPGFQQGDPNERTMFAVTTKNGKTRIYAGTGDTGPDVGQIYSQVFRTDDASAAQGDTAHTGWISLTSNDLNDPHYGTYNYCWQQCWYDNDIISPPGRPDTVYVLGAYQYGEAGNLSNARAVTVSYTAGDANPAWRGSAWADLTRDATPSSQPNGIHPDQHELVLNPSDPSQFFEGSDGGLMVADGKYVDDSSACDTRGFADVKDGPTAAQQLAACKRLLSYVPHQLNDNLNRGLETLQFQTVSVNPENPLHNLMGGTQDNGTFEWTGAGNGLWWQVMYGDGGQSGFDATDGSIRFNNFTSRATDSNFAGGDPRRWVVVSGPLYTPGPDNLTERVGFYPPITQDTVLHGYRYFGQSHIWRTTDNGGDQAYLEATCPEFTTFANDPKCGDFKPMGGPPGRETAGSLAGSTTYGGGKTNAAAANNWVSAIERAPSNDHTLWAGTSGGRLFVTDNANAANPADVVFFRIDTASQPNRYPSGLAIDPANPYHAFVSFTGYNASTPSQPGHVFDVVYNPVTHTATWTNLNVEAGFADYPITDVAYDSATGDLYASNDFGVLKGTKTGPTAYSWAVTAGLPRVEVSSLTIVPSARVLYAATHGRSIWRLMLG